MKNTKQIIDYKPIQTCASQSVHDFFAVRTKNGAYQQALRQAFCRFYREPTCTNLKIFGVHFLRMLIGDVLMNVILSDKAIVVTGMYGVPEDPNTGVLYHFTPTNRVEQILSSGLCPRDRYVYLTDEPKLFSETFLNWKTERLGGTTAYTLLQVDVQKLLGKQAVFHTDREHEFVTGKIDAKYISVVPDSP